MKVGFLSGAGSYLVLNARFFPSINAMHRPAPERAKENVDQHQLGARLAKESNVTQQ